MPKLSDFAPKPLVLGAALLGAGVFDSTKNSANAQDAANPPAASEKTDPEAAPNAEYLRGREEGIQLGKQIAKLENALDTIDKSSALLDVAVKQSLNPKLQKDWQDDYKKIASNQKFFRDQIKKGNIDAELTFKTLEMTIENLEVWGKLVSNQEKAEKDKNPQREDRKQEKERPTALTGRQPTSFHEFLTNPSMDNVHVFMSLPEYRAYQAMNILQGMKIEGMPDMNESLQNLERGLNTIADPNNKFRKGKGLGASIAEPLNKREEGQKSLRELNEESREKQKAQRKKN